MLKSKLKRLLENEGFELLGIVKLTPEPEFIFFKKWLQENKNAKMSFLERYQDIRQDPRKLEKNAKIAICVGLNYFTDDLDSGPYVARYARLSDYHKVFRKKLSKIMEDIAAESGEISYRITSDSAPLLERALAARCELGFIGKNTMYIHPQKGSYFLLGEILTDLPLTVDDKKIVKPDVRSKETGGCGSCKRCQVYCPTGALSHDYQIDARKCLAYYSIEHRDVIPFEYWKYFAISIFGCDICQKVCPYNKKVEPIKNKYLKIKKMPELKEIALMSHDDYIEYFSGTPMTRAKKNGLQRNAIIAMVVTKDPGLEDVLLSLKETKDILIQETIKQIKYWKKNDLD